MYPRDGTLGQLPVVEYRLLDSSGNLRETIDAVAKWQFPGETDSRICFLQLTKAQTHKCDTDILWRLAQPFVGKAKMCFIALRSLPDEEIRYDFRSEPAVISKPEVLEHVPVYVASYRLG
ncbi:hypothetical protein V7S43_001697 [Phytophthora oleae]|uniref:Uncharacterized protein n=1 Tax=Phytophthora oleae TaxID=2107226 RepID=A0ABD3G4F5_9STRA